MISLGFGTINPLAYSTGRLRVERIVIVDEDDNVIGEEDKEKCHDDDGILHRAILVMVFTLSGELLLTRRSDSKRLWPGYWDGTVASHPVNGEDYEQASRRRLRQEIGLVADDVRYLFKFRYNAQYKNIGSENEMCGVTIVRDIDKRRIMPDRREISAVRAVAVQDLMDEVRAGGKGYTPWLILALQHLERSGQPRCEHC
jgi:isopentenyl-diphosphate delta-isomerase